MVLGVFFRVRVNIEVLSVVGFSVGSDGAGFDADAAGCYIFVSKFFTMYCAGFFIYWWWKVFIIFGVYGMYGAVFHALVAVGAVINVFDGGGFYLCGGEYAGESYAWTVFGCE
jgi:hypothetical protein